jgi:alkaline phosphatase
MKKGLLTGFFAAFMLLTVRPTEAGAQPVRYTVANTHSHNDYEQPTPFWMAWREQFGSIEADIWLVGDKLLVGHSREEIRSGRTLEEYYLKPLLACIEKNKGRPYADTARRLQILIDVKTDSVTTLQALISLLDKFPILERTPLLTWAISGKRPPAAQYASYPSFISFDGILHDHYASDALSRIVMMSDDLRYYTHWDGRSSIPAADKKALEEAIAAAHRLHLPVRLWDAPDFPSAWLGLEELGVDYINTDHIHELAVWLAGGSGR